jgi:hypothetical protein
LGLVRICSLKGAGEFGVALRGNHYDAAFEAFLRDRRTPYVAVDEHRRALLEHSSLKSMDFIVYSQRTPNLLVDVKGRRFPSGGTDSGHKWENWATAEDLPSLIQWQKVFGGDFRAVLVFAYQVIGEKARENFASLFDFRQRTYAFYGVWADEYERVMQTRSASWQTVSVPSRAFRALRSPIGEFL